MAGVGAGLSLVCRVGTLLCALPIEHVVETMRPLPVEPISGAPRFVRGLAIIRGEPVPVVDAGRLVGNDEAQPGRFVTLQIGARRVSLAVSEVLGARSVAKYLRDLPPLLGDAETEVIGAIGTLDSELLVVLRSALILPEGSQRGLAAAEAS